MVQSALSTEKVMNEAFLGRLKIVLADRQKHPWGQSFGSNRGTIDRMFRGHVPTEDTLNALSLKENTHITWLLTGRGSPYATTAFAHDHETVAWLNAQLPKAAKRGHVFIATAGIVVAMIFPQHVMLRHIHADFERMDLVTGFIGKESAEWLNAHSSEFDWYYIPNELYQRMIAGQIGSYTLLGDNRRSKGLVEKLQHLSSKHLFEFMQKALHNVTQRQEDTLLPGAYQDNAEYALSLASVKTI